MTEDVWCSGGIVSVDPIVTYSGSGYAGLGLAPCYPEVFRGRRALHFVSPQWTTEGRNLPKVAEFLGRMETELPGNLFVFAAGTDYENYLLTRQGLLSIPSSHVALMDEGRFRVMAPNPALPRFSAVYNARLDAWKRHELAAGIDDLMLIYYSAHPASRDKELERVRSLLPNAFYANRELNGEDFSWVGANQIIQLFANCEVGLCLSAREGVMRASMEYLLCGLPVVSTPSVGGRDRYYAPPYAIVAEPTPDAIAGAVRELQKRRLPRQSIRDHILRILAFERHHFLQAANRIAKSHFGVETVLPSLAPFRELCNSHRTTSDAMRPLAHLIPPEGATCRVAPPDIFQATVNLPT